jgi:5-methylcytosine-specific restriction endonuclease McrBC GTP-binding regulatory subunit McrB
MTVATNELINELSEILERNKYLLLSGGTAVGKTYVALQVASKCRLAREHDEKSIEEYEVKIEFIPIHSSYSYEDFVAGMAIETQNGVYSFEYKDRIFLTLLKKANESWQQGKREKYVLILDDIGRGMISGILGDTLPLIEPHGNCEFHVSLQDGTNLTIPPNLYIIATRSTLIDNVEPSNYGFLRHFYHREIESDFRYIIDNANEVYSDYDVSPNAMFHRTKRIVLENLRYRNQISKLEINKYIIGHGVFDKGSMALVMKYQVLPILKQYVKDNILDRTAKARIVALEKLVNGDYSKDISAVDNNMISGQREDVTPEIFYDESLTHRPIVNLVARIKTQGLMSDADMINLILFNPGVLVRKSATLDGATREFPAPAYLFVRRSERGIYSYGRTRKSDGSPKRPRYFYSSSKEDILKIDGVEYASAAEMQPKEYTRWSDELNSESFINERGSSSPNSIMFRILRSYYKCLDERYGAYLTECPSDENVYRLRLYARNEFGEFIRFVKQIGTGSDEADVNLERNRLFREAISNLRLLWTDIGETLIWNGESIKVEGVYKVNKVNRYKEYSKAMDKLDIHQMIMQGPPGTSKTYSAREYLKFIGKGSDNEEFMSEDELDEMQIKNYETGMAMCEWSQKHPDTVPPIAWDIVQFHPSYGYEDFVRGIEVSTIKSAEGSSQIAYDTVNKILGKIADVASRPENKNTKFFLVIDEINRANLATVFGELIYGLEYRNQSVATPYTVNDSNKIKLPDNLYILGTMNTADKSIGGIDYAIRRRFLFFSLLPERDVILNYKISDEDDDEQTTVNQLAVKLFDEISKLFNAENLNTEYYKDDVQIGHTYFLVDSDEQLYLRFKYQIIPILREYYKDGMFQLEEYDTDDGFNGLLSCISGDTNLNSDDELMDVYNKLLGKSEE